MRRITKVNPSTLRPKGRSLLRVDTERRLFPRPEGWGLGAVERVNVLQGFRLELTFDDGVCRTVDLSDLSGKGVFALWGDRRAFEQVRIGSSGELVRNDKIDLCPDSLYLRTTGKKPEDIFPSLRHEPAHA